MENLVFMFIQLGLAAGIDLSNMGWGEGHSSFNRQTPYDENGTNRIDCRHRLSRNIGLHWHFQNIQNGHIEFTLDVMESFMENNGVCYILSSFFLRHEFAIYICVTLQIAILNVMLNLAGILCILFLFFFCL